VVRTGNVQIGSECDVNALIVNVFMPISPDSARPVGTETKRLA